MRFLHTSDWHLGQKFLYQDRRAEHGQALDWLIETIVQEQVDCLLVSGDVFDIGNPPNYARRMYYQFLRRLLGTCCRHIVITGGNHDSPAMLNAPKDLLAALQVHIVGETTGDLQDELIELRDATGKLEAVVAAVPFLRDRDVRSSVSGETGQERIEAIRAAIQLHYEEVGALATAYTDANVPILAMGHLFVKHAKVSAKHDNIYINDRENIAAERFPAIFDYVALGHIHRAQLLDARDRERIWYSGSIIPLSFSETKDDKVVQVVDFDSRTPTIRQLDLPVFRRLKTVKGTQEYVQERLQQLDEDYKDSLPTWVDVLVETDVHLPNLGNDLREFSKGLHLELLKIRTNFKTREVAVDVSNLDLTELSVEEVFLKKCASDGYTESVTEELLDAFRELRAWQQEQS